MVSAVRRTGSWPRRKFVMETWKLGGGGLTEPSVLSLDVVLMTA
jgi:hypothetical protein